ncbi:MAG: hydrogenase maturation protease [Isosphaeraceae bacterium]
MPDGAQAVDFGIWDLNLAYALAEGHEAVILVDAAPRGGKPGTLYVLDLSPEDSDVQGEGDTALVEAHQPDPVKVLRLARALGDRTSRVYLVGCEPGSIDPSEDLGAELSEPVRAAACQAVPLIVALVARLLRGEVIEAGGDTVIRHSKQETETCWN